MARLFRFKRRRGFTLAAVMASLAACGNVSVPPGADGAPSGDGQGDDDDGDDEGGADDAPPPDAAPSPDARPPSCEDGVTQLLVNPSFEEATPAGATGWSEVSLEEQHLTFPQSQLPLSIEDGNRAAWLGRAFADDQRLSQTVRVPAETSELALSYAFCFVTLEQNEKVFDTVTISLLDDGGGSIGPPLREYSNIDAVPEDEACFWDDTRIEIGTFPAGEEVTLELRAITDGATLTSFYFDAMSLEATGPCPDGGL